MASGTSKNPHKSFKRTYREDYVRDLEVPGMAFHVFNSFKLIFGNSKIFLPFILIMILVTILLVGVADEFLNGQTIIFGSLVFLVIWLVTIFVLRQKMAGNKITLRDALYNAMTPLISNFVMLFVVAIQCIPIMLLVIAYSSAIETHFLDTPFYAFLFLTFAGLMVILSCYLLSSTIMALVAVSAPGMYPLEAFKNTNELMRGRRIKFILRIILLAIVVSIIWILIMYPINMWASSLPQFPLVKICGIIVAVFLAVYISVYFYSYYRWMLRYDNEKEENEKRRSRKKNS